MVNPFRGDVALRVQPGVSLTLRFTAAAIVGLQDEMGIPMQDFRAFVLRAGSPRDGDVARLVFAGCQALHAAQVDTLEVAARLVDLAGETEAFRVAIAAFVVAWPETDPEPQNEAKPFSWNDLLREALRAGLDHDRFWAMTPREIAVAIRAAQWRRDVADLRATEAAYRTALWSRAARFPSWNDVKPSLDHHLSVEERATKRKAAADDAFRRAAAAVGATVERVH